MLERTLVWFTWISAIAFLPLETYVTWSIPHATQLSGYVVNILGVGIMLWGVVSLRKRRAYAEGLLATGWGWMTAVFWRATNLRYWLASEGEPLSYGTVELWLAPVFTMMTAAALIASLVLLLRRHRGAEG